MNGIVEAFYGWQTMVNYQNKGSKLVPNKLKPPKPWFYCELENKNSFLVLHINLDFHLLAIFAFLTGHPIFKSNTDASGS
jgi:hypothetical protein